MMCPVPPVRRVARLAPDQRKQAFVQVERRLRQQIERRRAHQARELHEDLVDVLAKRFLGGQQAVVGVRASGAWVIVSRAEVDVAFEPAVLAAHHQRHLAMSLVADDAVYDVRAGFLQLARKRYVRSFVEPCAQLDQHGYFFASLRRGYEAFRQRRVRRRAIQRLLDRKHIGIVGGAVDEVDDRGKRLVRMMQQDVALRDRVENARVHELLRHSGRERRIFELRTIDQIVYREQAVEVHGTRHLVGIGARELEVLEQIRGELVRAVVRRLESHRVAVAAFEQLALERVLQIVHVLVVDEQIAVACDAELIAAVDLHAREQLIDERVDNGREEHEIRFAGALDRHRQGDQARQRARRLHDRAMTRTTERVAAVQAHDEVQALVQNSRDRPCRVERRRAQDGHDLGAEILLEPQPLGGRPIVAPNETDAFVAQRGDQLVVEHAVLLGHEQTRLLGDDPQQLGGPEIVRPDRRSACCEPMLQARDANLEKLVEIRRRYAEELQPLEQRHGCVSGLVQDAHVERELRQLTVDVVIGQLEIQRIHGGLLRVRRCFDNVYGAAPQYTLPSTASRRAPVTLGTLPASPQSRARASHANAAPSTQSGGTPCESVVVTRTAVRRRSRCIRSVLCAPPPQTITSPHFGSSARIALRWSRR